jgi:hypothetical protein
MFGNDLERAQHLDLDRHFSFPEISFNYLRLSGSWRLSTAKAPAAKEANMAQQTGLSIDGRRSAGRRAVAALSATVTAPIAAGAPQ